MNEKKGIEKPFIYKIDSKHIVFASLFLLIIPFLIWSQFASLDQISHAQGQVIAVAKTQEIQATTDGVIEKIFVIKVLVISYQTFHHTYNVNFPKNLYKNTLLYLL